MAFISGEKGQILREGNREIKNILVNSEHKETLDHGNKPIYFRGTSEHVPPGRAST